MKKNISKTLVKTTIAFFILIILTASAGLTYVYFTDHNNQYKPPASIPQDQADPIPKPVAPAPNAGEGVAVESITTPVTAGSNSSIIVTTNAGSACTIVVSIKGVPSTDSGLMPKTADAYGNVTWTWTVSPTASVGNWPIVVTCVYHGRAAVVDSSFQVVTG